ncbi:MAG: PfkB family carbohydrate kinase [Chloroflexota bacterium]
MIVVVGTAAWNPGPPAVPAGRACSIALAAAGQGARVELVGRIGDDAAGDDLLLALGRAGVGHVAVLRDPSRRTPVVARPTPDDEPLDADAVAEPAEPDPAAEPAPDAPRLEPADVALGLQYLTSFEVLVVTEDAPPPVVRACVEAAQFAGARLVVCVAASGVEPPGLPPDATVLAAPDVDGDAFAGLVGSYAAALDRGEAPEAAFGAATSGGWERPQP